MSAQPDPSCAAHSPANPTARSLLYPLTMKDSATLYHRRLTADHFANQPIGYSSIHSYFYYAIV